MLTRALAGDAAAFGMLVRIHQRSVYSLARRMVSDRQKAEDLAQEVFLQLHRNLTSVESGEHLAFWLRKVTVNRSIDRLRREPMFEAIAAGGGRSCSVPKRQDTDPLLTRRLNTLIAQLPAAPRAVLLLRYQEDLDPTEIARTLGMSVNTVKAHLKRSLSLLRKRLGDTARSST